MGSTSDLTLGNGLTAVSTYAFSGCVNLRSVVLGDGIADLGAYAFQGCTRLTNITFGAALNTFEASAVEGATNLESIAVVAANPHYSSADGVLFNKAQTILMFYPPAKTGAYVVPDGVVSIAGSAARNCKKMLVRYTRSK